MTNKRKITLLIIMIFSILMTGCGNAMVELTPEESAVISEYAVGLLLKYDKNHKSRIMSDREMAEAEEKQRIIEEETRQREQKKVEGQKSAEQADSDRGGGEETEVLQNADIADFLGLDNFTVNYQGYELAASYPATGDDMIFAVDATQGCQLLVLHFNIVNQSQNAETCDILSMAVRSKVMVNKGQWKNTLVTMLYNDFAGFQETIEAGNGQEAVIIAEYPQEDISGIESIALNLKLGDDSIQIGLE